MEMRYSNLEEPDSVLAKIKRSSYLIVSISLLTHTFSIIYSLLTFKQQSSGFISIIVSSIVCFFMSSSHLTIYGISVLGCLYINMISPYYTRQQMYIVVALSGVTMFIFWKFIHSLGTIFHCLPGRIHASMVLGIVLIVLAKFFPLAIENIPAFFILAEQHALQSPFYLFETIFSSFNVIVLVLTIVIIIIMFFLRQKLQKIPLIGIMVIVGILINISHHFKSETQLCAEPNVNCEFYIIKIQNLKTPFLYEIIEIFPASIILTIVLIFQQFLYLEQFQRRGKRFKNEGNLGEVTNQTRTLAIANLISGCLGGLPICINIFGTYQNFAFNKKYGFRGTKWVGLLQVPFSYLLYSLLHTIFVMIPLFVLFIVVATPIIYFMTNVLVHHKNNLLIIIFIAALNVLTHPLLALVFASLISIYDISEMLRPSPAQMLVQNIDDKNQRRSSLYMKVVKEQRHPQNRLISEFAHRVIEIQEDIPPELEQKQYVIYRFIGSVSFLNYFQHAEEMNRAISKFCREGLCTFIISLRYSQIIDIQSLNELAFLTNNLKREGIKIIFTGLHERLLLQMQHIPYFSQLLQEEQKCMYSIHTNVS